MAANRYRNQFRVIVASVIAGAAVMFAPLTTFPGRYKHHASGTEYEFRDGIILENGQPIGRYVVRVTWLRVSIEHEEVERFLIASVGWNRVTLDLPKFGTATLIKVSDTDP